jgi:S1-C subfamily serine protease
MCRPLLPVALMAVVTLAAAVRGEDRAALKDALALEECVQDVIREVEPSVACIAVSRSELYRTQLRDAPPPDSPGRLGDGRLIPSSSSDNQAARELQKLDLSNPDTVPESFGSGVVIDADGLVLTHYHVVRDATKVYVRLPDGRGSWADIHAADPRSDLAVLRLLNRGLRPLKPIKLGDGGSVRKGKLVIALANPFAAGAHDGSPSASWGIVSNVRRRNLNKPRQEEDRAKLTLHHYGTLLQTDARLNLGCSGGALVDLKGELIGLTTSLAALSGLETAGGYAVPVDGDMRRVIEVLRRGEEVSYGFLGIGLDETYRGEGVRVARVSAGSPADAAGLGDGWRILSINGSGVQTVDDLFLKVGMQLAGTRVKLEVIPSKNDVPLTREATLAKFYVPGKIIASKKPPWVRGLRVDYASVQAIRDSLENRTSGTIPRGVSVREVLPHSPADGNRLQDAVITHVNGRPVTSPAEFYREADKLKDTDPLELTLGGRAGPLGGRTVRLD